MGAPARRSSPPPVPPSSPKPAGGRARSAGVRIPRMTRRGRPGDGPVRLFCARRPRPGPACRSSSSAAPHVRAAAVPGGPGRTDVDAVVDDDRDDHPRRSGCPRSCRPRRPPASPPPPGKSFRPTDPVPPPARPPRHVLDGRLLRPAGAATREAAPPCPGWPTPSPGRCRHPRGRPAPGGVVSVMSPGLALRQVGSQESSAGEFRRAGLARREAGWTVSR